MELSGLERLIFTIDEILDTRRKRHLIGGVLLSVSLLFGGLAVTVITVKNEEEEHHEQ